MSSKTFLFAFCVLILCTLSISVATPAYSVGLDYMGICVRNCAQCKRMFGNYFDGPACADSCLRFRGKIVPDCEDLRSIEPFLTSNGEKFE
ncbi:eclosion hormone [Ctenocephalides felis]|uniref:eclosion hormone n=1 Tax=Ctenocephalides felis TaxID=7515 RepID=UPI000E6E3249|nr:eclosion hormone [Ctenocephalides felis]